jgi:hypothetical protein
MNKPIYNQHGERIDDDMYYHNHTQKRTFDFVQFFKLLAFIGGVVLFLSFLIELISA